MICGGRYEVSEDQQRYWNVAIFHLKMIKKKIITDTYFLQKTWTILLLRESD